MAVSDRFAFWLSIFALAVSTATFALSVFVWRLL